MIDVDPPAIAAAVAAVRSRIEAAATRAGRDPSEVLLVAATKTVPTAAVQAVVDAGVIDVGENRAQELVAKAPELAPGSGARWHLLGRLQRNKVRALAPWITCWQSVDRGPLGSEIARRAPGANVLVEVNLAGEAQKGGCPTAQLGQLIDTLRAQLLVVDGLMTVPPHDGEARRWFAELRELGQHFGLSELSMGMTDDFEIAVEEGATIVRVGRALFGPRPS